MKYATIENAVPIVSGNAIKQPGFAMHWPRCDDRGWSNGQLVFIEF
jgi:hypothetical protein